MKLKHTIAAATQCVAVCLGANSAFHDLVAPPTAAMGANAAGSVDSGHG